MSELKDQFLSIIKKNSKTPDAEFLASALDKHLQDSLAKYMLGYEEHGGSIMDRPMIAELDSELIDANHYIQALRVKRDLLIQKVQALLIILAPCGKDKQIQEILNLLINL
jgi:hypothetical protein